MSPHEREREQEAADAVRRRLGGIGPSVAIVLGSGLGEFSARLRDAVRIPCADIPHFPRATVAGHSGELIAGKLGDTAVVVQSGRLHLYEGHAADVVALPIRIFAALGVDTVVLTNAAGGIRRTLTPGTVMVIADHLNLTGRNPLLGPVRPGEERFPDMSAPYDPALRALAREVAKARNIPVAEGVYAGVLGPSYETPAEIRMLESLGGDAVGMSTVTEAIAARGCRLRCLGLSAITNFACGVSTTPLSHAEVLAAAREVGGRLSDLLEGIIAALPPAPPHG
jgi:purine-nucleoside phosphorylase